ncbi:MAG: hypothetical protein K2K92_05575, partial [Duncaniella sp.]|nr:hypothetical protein [Duncaniella sp.]
MRLRHICQIALLISVMLMTSCSTTRRIPSDELLYTGLKGVEITTPDNQKFPTGVRSQLTQSVSVKPNNPLLGSASYRTPFPIGLWVYNNWPNPPKGLKHWIYDKLAAEPVLVSDVRPQVRTHMLDRILEDNGYFSARTSYELVKGKKNSKKAGILYKINSGEPYLIDSIELLPDTTHLFHLIDSAAGGSEYLRIGARYCLDSLSTLRNKIANAVREHGYYFFRPEYIQYLADSTIRANRIALRMELTEGLHPWVLDCFRTGTITTTIQRYDGGGAPDTTETRKGKLILFKPARLRKGLIPSCIALRQG